MSHTESDLSRCFDRAGCERAAFQVDRNKSLWDGFAGSAWVFHFDWVETIGRDHSISIFMNVFQSHHHFDNTYIYHH